MTIHKTISALTVVTILSGCQTWTVSDWSNVNQPKTAVAVKTEDGRYMAVAPGCHSTPTGASVAATSAAKLLIFVLRSTALSVSISKLK